MRTLLNKIFADSETLSTQELEKYLKRKATTDEAALIEKKIQNNPFNSDAIEGYVNNQDSINDLNDIQKRLKAKYKSSFSWTTFFTVFIIVTGLSFTIIYFLQNFYKIENQLVQVVKNVESKVKNSIFINENFYNKSVQKNENPKEESFINKTNEIIETQSKTTEQIEKIATIAPLDCLKSETYSEIKTLNRSIIKTMYIYDLKVVDYRGLRIKKSDIQSGLSSVYENKSKNSENNFDDYIAEQPYIEFLSNALKLFNTNDYKNSNKEFNIILTYFADDANAIFYSGLSYFQMADYKKAEKQFIKMLNHSYNTFYEESQWYLAQTYLLSGNKKEAINLLKKISNEDGFYSQRAKDKLDEF